MTRSADCSIDDLTVAKARKGDMKAHEHLFNNYAGAVYNLALRITCQPAIADEILQDTFVIILTKIGTFRGDAKLGTWIREITVNNCLLHLRSGWHRKRTPLESVETESQVQKEPNTEHMDLEKALTLLPDISRTVVWLHDVEGYTHLEIGRLMGRTTSFSKSQLARAHKRLQALLETNKVSEQQCMQLSNNF